MTKPEATTAHFIASVSMKLLSVHHGDMNEGIHEALRDIGKRIGVDRVQVVLFRNQGRTMDVTHEWCAGGIEPQKNHLQGQHTDSIPWSALQLKQAGGLLIPQVADLPPEAQRDKEVFQRQGLQSLVWVPLPDDDDRPMGLMGFHSVRKACTWGHETVAVLKLVGEVVATALVRLEEETVNQEKAFQLKAITDSLKAYLDRGSCHTACEILLETALRQTESEYGFVGVVLDGRVLRIVTDPRLAWDSLKNHDFSEAATQTYQRQGYLEFNNLDTLLEKVITSQDVVVSNDPMRDLRSGDTTPGHPPLRTFLGVPVFQSGDLVGIIGVSNRPGGYSKNDQNKISILTKGAGVLLAHYLHQEKEKERDKTTHDRINTRIWRQEALLVLTKLEASDPNSVIQTILETSARLLDVERVSLWIFNTERTEIVCLDLYIQGIKQHTQGIRLKADEFPRYFQALEDNKMIAADDAHHDPHTSELSAAYLTPLGIRSMLDVPVWVEGKMVGLVCHEQTGSMRSWTIDDQDFSASIADIVSLNLEALERQKAEEKWRFIQEAVAHAGEGMFWADSAQRFVYVNHEACRSLGYTREEFLNLTIADISPGHNKEQSQTRLQELRNQGSCHYESVHRRKNGEVFPVEMTVSVLNYQGQEYTCAIARDITERKHTERTLGSLAESTAKLTGKNFFLALVMNLAAALQVKYVFVTECVDSTNTRGRILAFWNGSSFNLPIEYETADTPGTRVLGGPPAHWPQDIQDQFPKDQDLTTLEAESYLAVPLYNVNHHVTGHLAILDTKPIPNIAMAQPILELYAHRAATELERHGLEQNLTQSKEELEQRVHQRTTELVASNRQLLAEIDERKKAEESLQGSETRNHALIMANPDLMIIIQRDGTYLYIKPPHDVSMALLPKGGPGKRVQDVLPQSLAQTILTQVQATLQSHTIHKDNYIRIFHNDFRSFETRYVKLGSDEVFCLVRDITEQKKMEMENLRHRQRLEELVEERTHQLRKVEQQRAQVEKFAALGQLAAGVAHEINNPLASLKSAFDLIKEAIPPNHEDAHFVPKIEETITRITDIVSHMYRLYGTKPSTPAQIDFNAMIQNMIAMFSIKLSHHQLTCHTQIPESLPPFTLPSLEISQILSNFIQNAIDVSPEGGALIIRVTFDHSRLRVSVADQGQGITAENQARMFDPFFSTKTHKKEPHMGLGLSLSKSLAESLGGTIEVDSSLGQGATLTLDLPIFEEEK